MLTLFLLASVFAIAVGGLLTAVDAALGVLSRSDLLDLAAKHRPKRSLRAIAGDMGAHTGAVNLVRVFSESIAAVLLTLIFAQWLLQWWWVLLASVVVVTGISFVLVGSSPRSVGRAHAKGIVAFSAIFVHTIRVVLGPIPAVLVALGDRVTPGRTDISASFASEEQLLSMVDEATDRDVLQEGDRELIHSIFEWGNTLVREVMIPRTDMILINQDASLAQALEQFFRTGVSRIPVIGEDVDQIVGVLYLRDVSRVWYEKPQKSGKLVQDLARDAVFVPESKKADETLRQMQQDKAHLALVVDEYGGIAGLVTLEDLMEELVGDISDEYDRDMPDITQIAEGVYRVNARLGLGEVGEIFGIELGDDDVDSVGGILAKSLGRLPSSGDRVSFSGLWLTAERVEGRRKRLVTVVVNREDEVAENEENR